MTWRNMFYDVVVPFSVGISPSLAFGLIAWLIILPWMDRKSTRDAHDRNVRHCRQMTEYFGQNNDACIEYWDNEWTKLKETAE